MPLLSVQRFVEMPARRFGALLGVTLWLLGLLVALMAGMLSGYLLASVVLVGSRAYTRLRTEGGPGTTRELPSGD